MNPDWIYVGRAGDASEYLMMIPVHLHCHREVIGDDDEEDYCIEDNYSIDDEYNTDTHVAAPFSGMDSGITDYILQCAASDFPGIHVLTVDNILPLIAFSREVHKNKRNLKITMIRKINRKGA